MSSNEEIKKKFKRVPEIVERNKKKAKAKKEIIENFKKLYKSLPHTEKKMIFIYFNGHPFKQHNGFVQHTLSDSYIQVKNAVS